jgi:cell division protein FtsB
MLEEILVWTVWVMVLVVAGTQIFVPLLLGRPLFPTFSSRERRIRQLKRQLEELQLRNEELKLEREIESEERRRLEARIAEFNELASRSNLQKD